MPTLSARAAKVVIVLDPAEVFDVLKQTAALAATRVPFAIDIDGWRLRAEFSAKSVRRCLTTLQQNGPEGVAVLVQGKLLRDGTIAEAGLVAQLKAPKPEPAAA
jgi:hypothetical protein